MANAVNPYGDGFASERICESILYVGILKETMEFVPGMITMYIPYSRHNLNKEGWNK